MRLGLFLDVRKGPGDARGWSEHYARTLERVTWADELGVDALWLTEHHGFEDGYLPQPLAFAAAVATVTKRARIGAAVVLASLRHPRHIAEEAALVDVISGGRLELGLGAGWSALEFAAFGVDPARRFALTDAAFGQVRDLLAGTEITPPAVQRPIPQWLGYQGPRGARRAGRLGAGLLSVDPQLLAPYLEGLAEGGHEASPARMGGLVEILVSDDPEATRERVLPYRAHQVNSYRAARGLGPKSLEALRERDSLQVLTPGDAAAALRERTAGLPVTDVFLWMSVGGMPDDLVDRHVELAITQVGSAL